MNMTSCPERPPIIRPYAIHPAITVVQVRLPWRQRVVNALWGLLVLCTGH